MHHLSAVASAARNVAKVALLGSLSTVVAAGATTWLITGSSDPNVWIADYRHALQCAVPDPALRADCYVVAAVTAVAVHAPERSAAPEPSPPSAEPPAPVPPANLPTTAPSVAPPAASYESDDGEGDASDS